LLVGSVVIEYVFNIPGVGRLLVDALRSSDLALMQGLTVGLTICTILAQLVTDVVAGLLDPRMRRW
jgi:peptide/nickel transport system permease protein